MVIAVVLLVSLAGQVISYRRSAGERRQQLKWLMGGFVFSLACLLLGNIVSSAGVPGVIAGVCELAGLLALPACMGVAILRYRLYDIDRIISRTLAYALITGVLVGVYAGLVLLATAISGRHSSVAIAVATPAPRPCSRPCAGGSSGPWTGASTGPGTTPTPWWPRSLPG